MRKQARVRSGPTPHDLQVVVRGGPVDASALRQQMDDAAAVFQVGDRPMHGFSVEGFSEGWELDRVLREGRVRFRATYATCTVGELRAMGCEVLATFGTNPPHFTVLVGNGVRHSIVSWRFCAVASVPISTR